MSDTTQFDYQVGELMDFKSDDPIFTGSNAYAEALAHAQAQSHENPETPYAIWREPEDTAELVTIIYNGDVFHCTLFTPPTNHLAGPEFTVSDSPHVGDTGAFDTWAIVELFGHSVIAGRVSEQQLGDTTFVRVDVPSVDDQPAFTKLFGAKAIYGITPTTEALACSAARRLEARPVQAWIVQDARPAIAYHNGGEGYDPEDVF